MSVSVWEQGTRRAVRRGECAPAALRSGPEWECPDFLPGLVRGVEGGGGGVRRRRGVVKGLSNGIYVIPKLLTSLSISPSFLKA